MGKLVREHTHAAIFGLDGVLANPEIAIANLDAAGC